MTEGLAHEKPKTEREVVDWVVDQISPFCQSVIREPELRGGGLRPDLGLRFKAFPDKPVAVEIKPFEKTLKAAHLSEAVRQCFSYCQVLQCVGAVGPIYADWNSVDGGHPHLFGFSVAGAINVGVLAFDLRGRQIGREQMRQAAMFVMSAQVALRFGYDQHGDAMTIPHPNAERLLTYKQFEGSESWRR